MKWCRKQMILPNRISAALPLTRRDELNVKLVRLGCAAASLTVVQGGVGCACADSWPFCCRRRPRGSCAFVTVSICCRSPAPLRPHREILLKGGREERRDGGSDLKKKKFCSTSPLLFWNICKGSLSKCVAAFKNVSNTL